MAKEKSITELKDERTQLSTRGQEIITAARTETRQFTAEENTELSTIQTRMAEINIDIAGREAAASQQGEKHNMGNKKFSLRRSLLEMADGEFTDETRQMNAIGLSSLNDAGIAERSGAKKGLFIPIEVRDSFTATGDPTKGSSLIDTTFMDILAPMRDRLVLSQAGASLMTGLRGNIDIPAYSGGTAAWELENAKAKDGGGTFSHKSMKPKRLTSILTVSRQLLVQDTLSVEQLLRSDLINAVRGTLEATILGNHAHAEDRPDGLFTGWAGAAETFGWAPVVDMETTSDLANALDGNIAYILHTVLRGKAKKVVKADSVSSQAKGALGFVMENDGSMNGYRTFRTNAVATNAQPAGVDGDGNPTPATPATEWGIAFGNWSDLLIGQWGALDLMVDPYTRADEAFVRIIVNSYWDSIVRRDASIVRAMMK